MMPGGRKLAVSMTAACALLCAQTPQKRPAAPAQTNVAPSGITIAMAESMWRAGNFQGASDAFKALVAANPNNADYRVRWGQLFAERFAPDEAQKLYQEALEIDPKNAKAYLAIAELMAEDFNSKAGEAADKA